jgi:hypothetical protein
VYGPFFHGGDRVKITEEANVANENEHAPATVSQGSLLTTPTLMDTAELSSSQRYSASRSLRFVRKFVNTKSRRAIRAVTVHLWRKFRPLRLALNEEQIPQIVVNNRNHDARWTLWKELFCAQGRCATRLRYAPTFNDLHVLLTSLESKAG